MTIHHEKLAELREKARDENALITREDLLSCVSDDLAGLTEGILEQSRGVPSYAVYILSIAEFYEPTREAMNVLANTSPGNNLKWGHLTSRRFYEQQREDYEKRIKSNTKHNPVFLECAIDSRTSPGYGSIGGPGFFRGSSEDAPPSWDDAVRSVEDSR